MAQVLNIGNECGDKSSTGRMLQPINPSAYASMATISNNEASVYMDGFSLHTPSLVTLASGMKMRVCGMFWRRVHVQLICLRESPSEQLRQYSAVLCVRRRHHGCISSSVRAISLDRRMHPVQILPAQTKHERKLMIGIEYGWRSQHVWFRAPNNAIYEQWNNVIRAALQGYGGGIEEESALSKWAERSGVSMVETAAMSAVCSVDRLSTDSYMRGYSSSYQSNIPDEEWTTGSEAERRGYYERRGAGPDDKRNYHGIPSYAARYRHKKRERTNTTNWTRRPAHGSANMRYDRRYALQSSSKATIHL